MMNFRILKITAVCLAICSFAISAKTDLSAHYNKLSEKRGDMVKIWDMFMDQAKKGDSKAIQSIFHASTAHFQGYYLSTYKFDLHELFLHNPDFFLSEGKKYFKDKGMCNSYWLLPRTGEIEPKKVLAVLSSKKKFKKDLELAKKFIKFTAQERNDNTKHCYKVLKRK